MLDKAKLNLEYHSRKVTEMTMRFDALEALLAECYEFGAAEDYETRIEKERILAANEIDRHTVEVEVAKAIIERLENDKFEAARR